MSSPNNRIRIAVGTRNAHKLGEIREILRARPEFEILGLDDLRIPYTPEEDAIEEFVSFHQNAAAKAIHYARLTGLPTLADDSGLAVDILGGAPGVHSKRFSGRADLTGRDLDRANNALLLDRLRDTPPERRSAHFICCAVLAFPHGPALSAIGTCTGRIAPEPRGSAGFGYDPLFLLPELGLTFAELPPEEKNRRSHRARAFRAIAAHAHGIAQAASRVATAP
ncbi:MAG TPA: non-canonical purine NTP pyrophosphatase [Longimicrobiales bacterium]